MGGIGTFGMGRNYSHPSHAFTILVQMAKRNPFDESEEIIGEGSQIMFISKNIDNDFARPKYLDRRIVAFESLAKLIRRLERSAILYK